MRAEDNVIVAVAHYGYVACHYHPIEAQKCPANARFPAILEGWAKVAKRICIREYFTALPPISQGLLRIAKGYALARDIPYFKRNNAIAINSEAVKEWGSAAINFYLAAKLMWNPSANVDALLDDYYRTAYGPAEGVMRKYYETLVQRITARIHTNEQIFTPEFWNELERLLNEAQRIVANVDDEGVRARVQIAIDYFKLQRLLNDAIMKRTPQAYKSLMDFIEARRDSLAFDYTMLRHRFLQPSTVRIIREVAKLRPIFEKADVKLPLRFPTVRGNHTFRLFIRAGEMIDSTVAVRQLGSYMQPTAFVLSDPSGREVMRGCATLAEPAKLNVKATVSGTWTLVVNSGSNGCVVTSQNRYAVLEGPQVHFLGATPKIYFYIPSGVDEAEISLRTSAPGETARLVVFNPDGNEVASGDTVSTSKCTLRFSIPQKYQGMVWSFRILPASRGTCEDNYINLGTMLPPYLGVHPKSLLISIH
ncbi:MAG TPA: DUF4838 domain-containing protein [Armatimonadetes bacterium]|nr:DUF4838 domain-containing protein [Armatimonadota bacterium]